MVKTVDFIVNGREVRLSLKGSETLLTSLREHLNLTGTKRGCDEGDCGACTVLLEGRPVNACLVLTQEVSGKTVTTIEGLRENDGLHPLQEAFISHNAVQCGFCTPGMIMSAVALLDENPNPTEQEIRRYLQGNLCRCTGYSKIVEAIQAAATRSSESGGKHGR